MPKYLFIVESPNKIHTIQPILGKDYIVCASYGHIRDLPKKKISIDIKKDFAPTYEILSDKKAVVKNIQQLSKKSNVVYIATDEDVEGCGIAGHISAILSDSVKIKRVKYNKITKQAILDGLSNAYDIEKDRDIFDAYEARRIIDRLAGYKMSWLVKRATGGISAGRVQSAGLRIISELEKKIINFVPIVYWPITAELLTRDTKEKVVAEIKDPKPLDISTKEEAEKIIKVIKDGPVKVSKFEQKKVNQNAYPPFTTSTLLQSASNYLGFSVAQTTKISQSLFEKSLITYIRTDSVVIDNSVISDIRTHVSKKYGKKYLPTNVITYKQKKKNVQAAHEAIRVIDISVVNPSNTTIDERKIYELIWKRTIASQMSPAQFLRSSAEFKCNKYLLSSNGNKELFDGFRKVWTYMASGEVKIPDMEINDILDVIDISTEKKETQPPKRYSEASFVKELEHNGVGRPSTYKSIVQTLQDRNYVEKIKKSLHATELGIKVSDYLIKSDVCFVDIGFTSSMEDDLDDITNQKANKVDVLSKFWCRLKQDLQKAQQVKNEQSKTNYECPLCKKKKVKSFLLKKRSQYGEFYSCENYKKDGGCKYTAQIDEDGKTPKEKEKKNPPKKSGFKCHLCGADMVIRKGPYGEFQGCSVYPKCRGIRDINGNIKKPSGKKWKKKNK